jgi:hypothetical protein
MQSVDFTVLEVKRTYLFILAGLFALWSIQYIIVELAKKIQLLSMYQLGKKDSYLLEI